MFMKAKARDISPLSLSSSGPSSLRRAFKLDSSSWGAASEFGSSVPMAGGQMTESGSQGMQSGSRLGLNVAKYWWEGRRKRHRRLWQPGKDCFFQIKSKEFYPNHKVVMCIDTDIHTCMPRTLQRSDFLVTRSPSLILGSWSQPNTWVTEELTRTKPWCSIPCRAIWVLVSSTGEGREGVGEEREGRKGRKGREEGDEQGEEGEREWGRRERWEMGMLEVRSEEVREG